MANSAFFSRLTKIGYPLFQQKLENVEGSENLPNCGGYIIAPNHIDWLDGFFVATAVGSARNIPVYFLTKSKYYWWTTVIIQIPKNKSAIIDQAVTHVRRGKVIAIFPEGQRNPTKKLLPGKTGAVRIALAAGVPIVPMGITCSYGRNVGQSLLNLMSDKHHVRIRIGQPMKFDPPSGGVSSEWLHAETERLMKAIAPLAGKTV